MREDYTRPARRPLPPSEIDTAWQAFTRKVELNELRRERGLGAIYLTEDKTRSELIKITAVK